MSAVTLAVGVRFQVRLVPTLTVGVAELLACGAVESLAEVMELSFTRMSVPLVSIVVPSGFRDSIVFTLATVRSSATAVDPVLLPLIVLAGIVASLALVTLLSASLLVMTARSWMAAVFTELDPSVSVPPSMVPVMLTVGVPRRLSVEADSVVVELIVVPGVTFTKSGMV